VMTFTIRSQKQTVGNLQSDLARCWLTLLASKGSIEPQIHPQMVCMSPIETESQPIITTLSIALTSCDGLLISETMVAGTVWLVSCN
jgi:hypothetical protein